jgi:probable HAF family extracellular repeat protein
MAPFNCTKAQRRTLLLIAAAAALVLVTAAAPVRAVAQTSAPDQPALDQSPSVSPGPSPRSPFPGFILTRGRYIPFEARDPRVQIFPTGINNLGVIVGEYIIESRKESIMLRDQRGRITNFDVPGARGTEATDINDRGQIVGTYSQDTPIVNDSRRPRAFLFDRGKLTRIDYPGATMTVASGVNNRGQVVGGYLDTKGRPHGYLWDKGRIRTIDVPGASGTAVGDINDRGEMVGVFSKDPNDPRGEMSGRGFLLSRGKYREIVAPDVAFTQPSKLNNRDQIVGATFTDATAQDFHGFLLAKGINGPFTPIDFPDASRTVATGINDLGQIVGAYENPDAAPTVAQEATPRGVKSTSRESAALTGAIGIQLSTSSP